MKLRGSSSGLFAVANDAGTQIANDNRWPLKAARMRLLTFAAAIAIFVADTVTSLDITVATLFVAVVLMASRFLSPRGIFLVGLGCIALTLLSWYLAPPAATVLVTVINQFISMGAIALVTLIAHQAMQSDQALFDSERRVRDVQMTLAHANRLTTMGELVASISHELKQPIGATVTNAEAGLQWLDASPPNLDRARQSFERIIKDAARANAIIVQTRELSKRSVPRKERLQINDVIAEVVNLLQHELTKHGVAVETRLSRQLPVVEADRIQVQQVVLNLVMNAVEAMSTSNEAPRRLVIESAINESGDVLVTVADNGPGFAEENAGRLFEAFYTTKASGTGMGLAICRSIVENHGGQLWADTNTNKAARGSVFRFTLPSRQRQTANPRESPIG